MGQSSQVASSYAYFTITIFSVCHGGKNFGKYFTRLSVPCQQGPCLTHVPSTQLHDWSVASDWYACCWTRFYWWWQTSARLRKTVLFRWSPILFLYLRNWRSGFHVLRALGFPGWDSEPAWGKGRTIWEALIMFRHSPPLPQQQHCYAFYVPDFK